MNILVTGGAGFIGSNFIHYWLENYPEDRVVNLDALTYAGNLENLKSAENQNNYKFYQGDILDGDLVEKIIKNEGIDTIVNFAAESHVDRSILDPDAFVKTNVMGTHVLLRKALENGRIRFHHISTDEVFGDLEPEDAPFNEENSYKPSSPYSASKASSDHLVNAYFRTFELPVTISNCSNNYGPFQFPEKLIPLFITNLMEGKKIPLYGDGSNVRDWLHVEDHCRAIDVVLKKGKLGETYCVGGGCEKTNKEITHAILEAMGKSENEIEHVADRPGHDKRYAIDYSKIKEQLGWEPKFNFKQGMKQTIEWYKNNANWWQNIKSGEYKDYYQKQYGK
ncbi:MAG: dTDP-glucose 4,6-dehydratase [Candidatus Moranbacteria bacterium]|nr:dTDP-glucose 4,6-dehydratase [Candidatus Moranbacteria bacterium]